MEWLEQVNQAVTSTTGTRRKQNSGNKQSNVLKELLKFKIVKCTFFVQIVPPRSMFSFYLYKIMLVLITATALTMPVQFQYQSIFQSQPECVLHVQQYFYVAQ